MITNEQIYDAMIVSAPEISPSNHVHGIGGYAAYGNVPKLQC